MGTITRQGHGRTRPGAVQVSEMQRARMLSSAVQVVSEYGYEKMSVARVAGRARVSRRTFYDLFADREDCFFAAFDEAVARAERVVLDACGDANSRSWRDQVRARLTELLLFFDEQPQVGSLLVVDALTAGPRVLRRRAQVLARVSAVLDRTGSRSQRAKGSSASGESSGLVGEGVVGAVFSVLHTRLVADGTPEMLADLLNPLMAMIVLPYLGPAAAQRELRRPVPEVRRASKVRGQGNGRVTAVSVNDPLADLPMRLTYRTMRVLGAITERPGSSNREIGDAAGASDQGQISKLLTRLEKLGLVENTTGQGHQPTGEPNAWCLTALGERVSEAMLVSSTRSPSSEQVFNRGVSPSDSKEKR